MQEKQWSFAWTGFTHTYSTVLETVKNTGEKPR